MITTQIDDLVGRPTGVKTQAFLYVLCGLAEAAVYVALLPLLRSLIAGDYVAAGYLVAKTPAFALSWWLSGLSYDAMHGVGNFVIMLLLYRPLRKALQTAKRQLRVN